MVGRLGSQVYTETVYFRATVDHAHAQVVISCWNILNKPKYRYR